MANRIVKVGEYPEKFNTILQISLPTTDIFIYPGFEKHIQKKHKNCMIYVPQIPEIICNPDYIGKHPSIANSIELVKIFDDNILISINLDECKGYLYVSSLYIIPLEKFVFLQTFLLKASYINA